MFWNILCRYNINGYFTLSIRLCYATSSSVKFYTSLNNYTLKMVNMFVQYVFYISFNSRTKNQINKLNCILCYQLQKLNSNKNENNVNPIFLFQEKGNWVEISAEDGRMVQRKRCWIFIHSYWKRQPCFCKTLHTQMRLRQVPYSIHSGATRFCSPGQNLQKRIHIQAHSQWIRNSIPP